MEFESPACTLSWRNRHTLVEVGCGLQVISGLLLQLLAELLSLYCSNVSYTGKEKMFCEISKQRKHIVYVCVQILDQCIHVCTFERRHTVCEFNLFATGIYSSSLLIQDKRCRFVHLLGFYFAVVTHKEKAVQCQLSTKTFFHVLCTF